MPKPAAVPEVSTPGADTADHGFAFTYGRVEAALAALFNIDELSGGAFKGRIKHFQRLGIVPSSPGKGKKITYDLDAVFKWALCLELAEFGIAPEYIKLIVEARGNSALAAMTQARRARGRRDLALYLSPRLLSGPRDILAIIGLSEIAPVAKTSGSLAPIGGRASVLVVNLTRIWNDLFAWLMKDELTNLLADDPGNKQALRMLDRVSQAMSQGAADKK